jgi:hypothetical protein
MGHCSDCHAVFDGGAAKNKSGAALRKFKRHLTGAKRTLKCPGHPPTTPMKAAEKRKALSPPTDTGNAEAEATEARFQAFQRAFNNMPTAYASSSTPAQRAKIRVRKRLQAILDFGLYPPQCQRLVVDFNSQNATNWTLAEVVWGLKRSNMFFEAVVEFLCTITIKIKNNDAVDLTGK